MDKSRTKKHGEEKTKDLDMRDIVKNLVWDFWKDEDMDRNIEKITCKESNSSTSQKIFALESSEGVIVWMLHCRDSGHTLSEIMDRLYQNGWARGDRKTNMQIMKKVMADLKQKGFVFLGNGKWHAVTLESQTS